MIISFFSIEVSITLSQFDCQTISSHGGSVSVGVGFGVTEGVPVAVGVVVEVGGGVIPRVKFPDPELSPLSHPANILVMIATRMETTITLNNRDFTSLLNNLRLITG